MASAVPVEIEETEGKGPPFDTLRLTEILEPDANLAEYLTDERLSEIGQAVIRDVEIDDQSRSEWLERYDRWMDMAMQVRKPKSFPWPGAASVKYPLLTTASIQFQARAYPAIVDGANIVKGRVLGPDPDTTKRQRADRMGAHMSWQLLYRMEEWEEETDRLLLMLPIIGSVFRKTYYDPIHRRNCSVMVAADDFIINYWAKSLETAPRYTQVQRYYPHEIREFVLSGLWLDIRTEPEQQDSEDDDAAREFYEQHRNIDLDGDGYPEPYVVTANKEGKIARITPCFGPKEVTVSTQAGTMDLEEALEQGLEPDQIISITRRLYFTKYGFIPAPDGSFYDIGFGWLLEDIGEAVNSTINRMMDAGTLQNAGGGFINEAVNQRGGELKFRIGEWKRIQTAMPLNQAVFPIPAPGPSPVLFTLLQMLISAAKEITSVQDVLTGAERPANTPATTTIATIEQAQKVMSSIIKRVHRAFGKELRILRRLNRDYLDDDEYFQLADGETDKIGRLDYADADLDVVPVSDPNMASDMQKAARANGLLMFMNDPLINQEELRRRVLVAQGQTDIKALTTVPKPGPDPALMLEMVKEARAKLESEAKARASDANAAKAYADAATAFEEIGLLLDAAFMAGKSVEIAGEENEPAAGPGGMGGMEGESADAGVPELPQGPPEESGDVMGGGGLLPPGMAGAGGAFGPAG